MYQVEGLAIAAVVVICSLLVGFNLMCESAFFNLHVPLKQEASTLHTGLSTSFVEVYCHGFLCQDQYHSLSGVVFEVFGMVSLRLSCVYHTILLHAW